LLHDQRSRERFGLAVFPAVMSPAQLARALAECGVFYEGDAHGLLGDIASHHARPDVTTAAAHYNAAMTLASELEMRPLVAHCHLGLGRLYRRARKPELARST
jgi:hypothetical protein